MHVELSEEFERGLSLLWSCHPLEDPGEASLESSDPADSILLALSKQEEMDMAK